MKISKMVGGRGACPGTWSAPWAVQALNQVYGEHIPPLRSHEAEARKREQRLADLVNQAYQLTPAEIELLWKTAPPRMPVAR